MLSVGDAEQLVDRQTSSLSVSTLSETMFREIIAWIGLLTSQKEPLEYMSLKKKDKKKKDGLPDETGTIFGYLRGLADESGHYDHLL